MNDKDTEIGWILAWLPEGGTSYNFKFYAAKSTFIYLPTTENGELLDTFYDLSARAMAETELCFLLDGKVRENGLLVTDGYVMPVYGNAEPIQDSSRRKEG